VHSVENRNDIGGHKSCISPNSKGQFSSFQVVYTQDILRRKISHPSSQSATQLGKSSMKCKLIINHSFRLNHIQQQPVWIADLLNIVQSMFTYNIASTARMQKSLKIYAIAN